MFASSDLQKAIIYGGLELVKRMDKTNNLDLLLSKFNLEDLDEDKVKKL